MRIQSKATDRAIVSVRPETDPKKQTGESALVNSTYTKTGKNNVNHYPPKRAKDYLILSVASIYMPDTYENSNQLITNCFGTR